MEHDAHHSEEFVVALNDDETREAYKKLHDDYPCASLPRFLGGFFVCAGNVVFGRNPSYLKFRAIEVIARVPYHSWDSAFFTLLTTSYRNASRAQELGRKMRFSRMAQDNETMHVVVISELSEKEEFANYLIHTIIPMLFAFGYFWVSYFLYILKPSYALELNYFIESHAFAQYSLFLEQREHELKYKPVDSAYLRWYGRNVTSHYEFFRLIRNDELIHRNRSIEELKILAHKS